jgi:ribonuclease P protein component
VLPAAVRMRASAEFSDTVANGARSAAGAIVVHLRLPAAALPVDGRQPDGRAGHVGLVVSRAVGNAVVRHRVSRRLRHLLADRVTALPPGSRLVVRALPAAADADSATLAEALDRALHRAMSRSTPVTAGSTPGGRR